MHRRTFGDIGNVKKGEKSAKTLLAQVSQVESSNDKFRLWFLSHSVDYKVSRPKTFVRERKNEGKSQRFRD
jgi:hypothetical protein